MTHEESGNKSEDECMEVKCKSGEETPEESENDNNPQVKYNDDGKYQQGHDDEEKNKAKGE